ncbi:MAG: hypothetical protein Q7R49_02590 [Candidatus Daviesbacteria bacterium]|nr:hypothetical protein [Candidatus Daviesbacteria bacterium]
MKNKKTITICSSASFYKQVLDLEKDLKKLGFRVVVPITARRMKKSGDFDVTKNKTWYQNPSDYKKKAKLMTTHFKKVIAGDFVLIVNLEKNGKAGYIGPNGLMEMAFAFYYKKPIFIYNQISDTPFEEEILGMNPNFINQDLTKILF